MKRDYVVEGPAFHLPLPPLPISCLQFSPLQQPNTGSPLLLVPTVRERGKVCRLGEGAAGEASNFGERLRLRPQLEEVGVGAKSKREAGSFHLQP